MMLFLTELSTATCLYTGVHDEEHISLKTHVLLKKPIHAVSRPGASIQITWKCPAVEK
jgi:hypothetical protein